VELWILLKTLPMCLSVKDRLMSFFCWHQLHLSQIARNECTHSWRWVGVASDYEKCPCTVIKHLRLTKLENSFCMTNKFTCRLPTLHTKLPIDSPESPQASHPASFINDEHTRQWFYMHPTMHRSIQSTICTGTIYKNISGQIHSLLCKLSIYG